MILRLIKYFYCEGLVFELRYEMFFFLYRKEVDGRCDRCKFLLSIVLLCY